MTRLSHLELPFFDDLHRTQAAELDAWCAQHLAHIDHSDTDAACRALVKSLGAAGHLRWCVPAAHGGALPVLGSRALVVARETLARHDGLADFAFAMQGLGTGAVTLAGSAEVQARVLPRVARGQWISAFALSEPQAGSDVAAMACSARDDGDQIDNHLTAARQGCPDRIDRRLNVKPDPCSRRREVDLIPVACLDKDDLRIDRLALNRRGEGDERLTRQIAVKREPWSDVHPAPNHQDCIGPPFVP